VEVYPDWNNKLKPCIGEKLNIPAVITLYKCHPPKPIKDKEKLYKNQEIIAKRDGY
jgi:hypothetical protein